MNNYWVLLVISVVGFILGKLEPKLREWVAKSNTKIDDKILDVALWIVPMVDEMFNGSTGTSKKQRAKDLIAIELAKQGVNKVKEELVDNTIEKALTLTKVAEYNAREEVLVPTEENTVETPKEVVDGEKKSVVNW